MIGRDPEADQPGSEPSSPTRALPFLPPLGRMRPALPRPAVARPAGRTAPRPNARRQWQTTPDSIVAWGWYRDGTKQQCTDLGQAAERARAGDGFVWLGLKDPTDEDMAEFARQFALHPLAIEDAVEGHTRSKLELFDNTLFAVITTVAYVDPSTIEDTAEVVPTGQIMVFVGEHFVLTVRRGENSPLAEIRSNLEQRPELLRLGPHIVLYSVLDTVVDSYVAMTVDIEEDVDDVEEAVFALNGAPELDRVYQLKREVIEFRRIVAPLGIPLQFLATREGLVPEDTRAYFREVWDHHTDAREVVTSFDEVLTNLLQAGLARSSAKENTDMRKMSAWLAILAVPTTVGAVYGMNFAYMPELQWRYSYFVVVGLILAGMLGLFFNFRHRNWL